MVQNRTHTCNDLRITHVGEQVKLCGWLENLRVVSAGLAFAVVRDFYGTTQIVAETEELVNTFKGITKESTISVEGVVRERDSKNPNMDTGDIEIVPTAVEVLGRCHHNELPFQINRSREADESARLKYRYLDLRNPEVKKNIILRCKVAAALRNAMIAEGFLEITTPILTASSPEGARDYLVPSLASCKNNIESVRKNALAHVEDQTEEGFEKKKHPKFELYLDKAGEYRFRLKAINGEPIGKSEGYKSKESALNGISSVGRNAPEADVVEEEAE